MRSNDGAPPPRTESPFACGGVRLRLATASTADQAALWHILYYASHLNDVRGSTPADVRSEPSVQRYVRDWGREGDLAVLAETPEGDLVGGVWIRLHTAAERHLPEFVDVRTPELGIAVLPAHQGHGVGGRLLAFAMETAQGRYPAVMLSVRASSPARRLYERFGFVPLGTIVNRVGSTSWKMLRSLEAAAPPPTPSPERSTPV